VESISKPLGLIVAYHALRKPAPYDPTDIVQCATTVCGVNRLLNLLFKHSFALRL
jgi:hypothetical protein